MDSHNKAITKCLTNAMRLENEKQLQSAEASYTRAILILKSALQDTSLSSDAHNAVKQSLSDIAKRIQKLRSLSRESPTLPSPPTTPIPPTSRPSVVPGADAPPSSARLHKPDDEYLNFLNAPAFKETWAERTGWTSGGASPSHTKAALNERAITPPGASPPSSKAFQARRPGGSRSPDWGWRAIDLSASLCRQGELKRAVDVLQQACSIRQTGRAKCRHLDAVKAVLREMREKYYATYPPRVLQDNPILPDELKLLRGSGLTSTIRLPCWDDLDEGYGAENMFMPCEGVWEDPWTPQLSQTQKQKGARLLHLCDLYPDPANLAILCQADPLGVTQTVVGDCSMVCSLIICASYQKRFPNAKIISNVIYPQDQTRTPIINPKGKYAVKMLINGITRLVTIDDRLPANPHSKDLLCTYSQDRRELWVSLMEKAFVKVFGGSYEFPGSTSASDLYMLSGWLPDSLSFAAKEFNPELQWKRLHHGFATGAVLITLMTPTTIASVGEQAIPLTPDHAYAVLAICEVHGLRILQLRNPWSRTTWKGALSLGDPSDLAAAVHKTFGYTTDLANRGVFLMKWEDAIRHFDGASLSWNPYLLYRTPEGLSWRPTRLACHGTYSYTTSIADMPQLHLRVLHAPKPTRMHLVFSRHITAVGEFGRQFDQNQPQDALFVSLKVFNLTSYPSVAQSIGGRCRLGRCNGRRLCSMSDVSTYLAPLNTPIYRNSFAHTTSLDCPEGTTDLVVVVGLQPSARKAPFNFTVTLHTQLPQLRPPMSSTTTANKPGYLGLNNGEKAEGSGVCMHWIPKVSLPYTASVNGAWVKGKSCGGRSDLSTFVYNPQYTFRLFKPAFFSARLAVSECAESCGICVVRLRCVSSSEKPLTSFGSRVGNLRTEVDLVLKSKLYAIGGALIDSALPQTFSYDPYNLLRDPAAKPLTKLWVEIKYAHLSYPRHQFYIPNLDENDEIGMIFIHAIKSGFGLLPSNSEVFIRNHRFDHTKHMKEMLALDQGLVSSSKDDNTKNSTLEVCLKVNTEPMYVDLTTEEDPLMDTLMNIVRDIIQDSTKSANHLPSLSALSQEASGQSSKNRVPLQLIGAFLTDFIRHLSPKVPKRQADSDSLSPLPAGEYTLIPSLWKKGVPGVFNITVESTEPVSLKPIPPEGDGLIERSLSGRLLFSGKALDSRFEVPFQLLIDDIYFQNSTISLSLVMRGVFTCRLLLLEEAENAEDAADTSSFSTLTWANVSLFVPNKTRKMDLLSTSGPYDSLGIVIPPIMLEARTNYSLVISSSKPSTCKYILRIYTSVPCTTSFQKQ
ncbi:unnamed protein product [Phytomonas sp. Hart1]|nr:unnamed protein product [Phytomonas sp. Hart1]|eukprot:CCW67636.1 unnamed protein product [Phytomonas sp. isolate Hart1]